MIRYATLFTVDIAHDYFLNRGAVVHEALSQEVQGSLEERYTVSQFMCIAPTECTESRLRGHQMIFKITRTGFLVAVKTNPSVPDLRPDIPPAADFRLSFKLVIRDPRFFNYTEISSAPSRLYRFGNDSGNEVAGQLLLTAPVLGYQATRAYEAGAIYAENANGAINLLRAVRDTGPAPAPVGADWERIPTDTWNPAITYVHGSVVLFGNRIYRALVDAPGNDLSNVSDWETVSMLANQYVNSADALRLQPWSFDVDLSGAVLTHAVIRAYRSNEIDAVAERAYAAASGTLGIVRVDLHHLAPGAYRLEVLDGALTPLPDLGFEFYLDGSAVRDARFGVIDIGVGSAGFALLDSGGALRSPRYTLRFLNRSTRWRYIFSEAQPVGNGAEVATEGTDPRVLVTDSTRPLTYFGVGIRLQADDTGTPAVSEEVLLPLPEPHRIRRENQQWYSEIHMSNLSL